MNFLTLKFTVEELQLLTTLASDQMFRKQYIDPRMPGYRAIQGEVDRGKALIGRLTLIIEEATRGAGSPGLATRTCRLGNRNRPRPGVPGAL